MRYHARVTKEGRHTLAEFPDCPGCATFADPGQDIAERAKEALIGWLETGLECGDPPPVARRHRARAGERLLAIDVPARLASRLMLRRAREEQGLTQRALAARAGVKQPQIAQLESPDANPTIDTLEKVARALGLRLEMKLVAA